MNWLFMCADEAKCETVLSLETLEDNSIIHLDTLELVRWPVYTQARHRSIPRNISFRFKSSTFTADKAMRPVAKELTANANQPRGRFIMNGRRLHSAE